MNTEVILHRAYCTFTDPGAPARDFDAARAVLRLRRDWTAVRLSVDAERVLFDMAPDRLGALVDLVAAHPAAPELAAACVLAFRDARDAAERRTVGMLPVRRAHALAEALLCLEAFTDLMVSDVVWLFEQDEYATPALYPALVAWCECRKQLPEPIHALLRQLREADDSPEADCLDHLGGA